MGTYLWRLHSHQQYNILIDGDDRVGAGWDAAAQDLARQRRLGVAVATTDVPVVAAGAGGAASASSSGEAAAGVVVGAAGAAAVAAAVARPTIGSSARAHGSDGGSDSGGVGVVQVDLVDV
jgi:hypothetical protein